jgi:hypothetical protein
MRITYKEIIIAISLIQIIITMYLFVNNGYVFLLFLLIEALLFIFYKYPEIGEKINEKLKEK